ncbi:MAG: ABC transporter substrate-binding protein [Corynebacterium sp.]|uniref:ABC transporter substrate-binding protein n=1 Tax=Corynebacterium sp. TaxID=1720 RepID=UPI0026DFB9C1|nr:ABC transporter substrate-binding protein [Corynebacterium sp.]MDO5670639.1 ABC transporter substrate-binding protein [Corynebacterium sp.]
MAIGKFQGGVAALAAAALTLSLAACTDSGDGGSTAAGDASIDHFGYFLDTAVVTSNAATLVGATSNTEALSGRLYPAVFVPGPSGQMIPNTDLVTTQVLPGTNRQVVYTLAAEASYSDGVPVTCTDFLLHYKAGVHDGLFGAHLPQTDEVLRMDCQPGSKRFTVVFNEDAGGRWRHLFGPGTVLPSHAIAERAGLSEAELNTALQVDDMVTLGEVAPIWREGFNLDAFDPQLHVSAGPFVIESVGESGEVVLAPNEHYYGDQPNLDTIVVWPRGADAQHLAAEGALRIADVRSGQVSWVDRNDPTNTMDIVEQVGDLTDTLMLGDAGAFPGPWAREAFAACVDQEAVAAASTSISGVEVPATTLHTLPHNDPLAAQLSDVSEQHRGVDMGKAQAMAGMTVRIGYQGPDERKAAMVEAIRVSCEPAGITVLDASEQGQTLADVTRLTTGQWGEQVYHEGPLDAVLMAIDPMAEYGAAAARSTELAYLRAREEELWQDVPSIPLAAQPRRFVIDRTVGNVVVYTGLAGIGWNMDRWLDDAAEATVDE